MSTLAISLEHVFEPTQIASYDGNLWVNPNGTVTLGGAWNGEGIPPEGVSLTETIGGYGPNDTLLFYWQDLNKLYSSDRTDFNPETGQRASELSALDVLRASLDGFR